MLQQHKQAANSPIILRKQKRKKSQQSSTDQAYSPLTLSRRGNWFTGAETPPNAPVILVLAAQRLSQITTSLCATAVPLLWLISLI